MFQLTSEEWANLQSQIATLKQPNSLRSQFATLENQRGKHRKFMPYAFTEQGVSMLSSVLHSDQAIETSIQIMQAFVNMRKFLLHNASVFQRLDQLELKQLQSDEKFNRIFKALEAGHPKPDKGIFFDGQVFDAYAFAADLIKSASEDIVLIDNYIDESIFTFLAKRKAGITATVYTKKITKTLHLDAKKHAQQYPAVELEVLKNTHDRFYSGWDETPEEARVKFVSIAKNVMSHPDFKDKVADNADKQNSDLALKRIMDEIMLKRRKANVEEYKRYAKDEAYYQGMFDLMRRMIDNPNLITGAGT